MICPVCQSVNDASQSKCQNCHEPLSYYRDVVVENRHDDFVRSVRFSGGNQLALMEETISRQFDEHGTLRLEVRDVRTWVAPATAVPGAALRALSSASFQYQLPGTMAALGLAPQQPLVALNGHGADE